MAFKITNSSSTLGTPFSGSVTTKGSSEQSDIYEAALSDLAKKVPHEISQKEYESFVNSSKSPDCTSEEHARDMLEDLRAKGQYRGGRFHKFFVCLDKLFSPLRFLKEGLDTLCQASSAFCLVWGSLKILMEVAKQITQVPAIITSGIDLLVDYFPIYRLYGECLSIRLEGGSKPLERPMVAIYVEYLTFCILVQKVAGSPTWRTIRHATQEQSPFKICLETLQREAKCIYDIAGGLTLINTHSTAKNTDLILEMMKSMNSTRSSSETYVTPHHIVPGLLSLGFVGREIELRWLEKTLDPENEKLVKARAGIHGLTGIGKTQLMLKYEAKYRGCYTAQLFLVASSRTKFLNSVQKALQGLDLRQHHTHDSTANVQELHNWLCQSNAWLLLIDNVVHETVRLILELLPADADGHIIVTSQLRGAVEQITGLPKTVFALQELVLDDAIQMFLAAADIDSDERSQQQGTEVVKAMGLMPHAIEQAASYIKVNRLDPKVFLSRYRKAPKQILDWGDGFEGSHAANIKETDQRLPIGKHLGLIFDSLEEKHPDALVVLYFFSYLEPESIPLFDEWFRPERAPGFPPATPSPSPSKPKKRATSGCISLLTSCFGRSSEINDSASSTGNSLLGEKSKEHPSDHLVSIFQDQDRRESAIAKLCDLHLTRWIKEDRVLWIHDITRKWVRSRIPSEDVEKWTIAGMDVVYHTMPESDSTVDERMRIDKWLPALKALISEAQSLDIEPRRYACLLALCALTNLHYGAWLLSREQFEKAWPLYEMHLGQRDPRTISVLHKLALATRHSGDMAKSEKYCRQAWKLYEDTRGTAAVETLEVLNDLASTIERAGRLKEAEEMFEKLYNRETETSGLESPRTMAAAHNYALCLHNQGRLAEAKALYDTALKVSEKYLGPEDPRTLKSLSNYAATLDHDGRFEEAQAVYERTLKGFVKVMGYDHHLTLRLRCNMAGLRRQQGNFSEAAIVMEGCLKMVEKIFGPDSFETITHLYEMGEIWQANGEIVRARDTFKKVMGQLSGDMMEHPVVFRFIDSWGAVEREMGHLELSHEKSKKAYTLFEKLLSWYDPYTLMAANDHAEVLHAEGRYQEAWDLLVRCRDSFATLLGREHPHYAMAINNLGRLCWALKAEDPVPLFGQARAALSKRVGGDHYCTQTVVLNEARTMFFAGDIQRAVEVIGNTQTTLKTAIGAGHPLVWACDTMMGMMLAALGDERSLATAEKHLRTAFESAKEFGHARASADYFLNICLLVLVLRRRQCDDSIVERLRAALQCPEAKLLSPWDIPGVGKFSAEQLAVMDVDEFDFKAYIPLAIGETIRLRWGRKTCWREAETAKLQE